VKYVLRNNLGGLSFGMPGPNQDGLPSTLYVRLIGGENVEGTLVEQVREISEEELKLIVGKAAFIREVEAGRIRMAAADLRKAGYRGQIPDSPFDSSLGDGGLADQYERKLEAQARQIEELKAAQARPGYLETLIGQLTSLIESQNKRLTELEARAVVAPAVAESSKPAPESAPEPEQKKRGTRTKPEKETAEAPKPLEDPGPAIGV
jgi:hypothetical protein